MNPAVRVGCPRQRVRGEIDAAKRVEAQSPAGAGLREGPECQWRLDLLGDPLGHSGIGEGDLQDQHQIERLRLQLRQGVPRRVLVEEKRPGADDLGVERIERGEGSRRRLLRMGHVERGARQRHHTDYRSRAHGKSPLLASAFRCIRMGLEKVLDLVCTGAPVRPPGLLHLSAAAAQAKRSASSTPLRFGRGRARRRRAARRRPRACRRRRRRRRAGGERALAPASRRRPRPRRRRPKRRFGTRRDVAPHRSRRAP